MTCSVDWSKCSHVTFIIIEWSSLDRLRSRSGHLTVARLSFDSSSIIGHFTAQPYSPWPGNRLLVIRRLSQRLINKTRYAWQSQAVGRQAQHTQAGDVTPLQRSNGRVCCLRDVICNEGVPFRPYRSGVVSAQRVFVPGDLDLWLLTFKFFPAMDQTRLPCGFGANLFSGSCHPLSNANPNNRKRFDDFAHLAHKWSPNHHDVGRTSELSTRLSAFPYYHPVWNANPKKESVSPISADFAPKIGCHGNVP